MKHFIQIVSILIILITVTIAQSNHFHHGQYYFNETLLVREIIQKKSSKFRIGTADYVFPSGVTLPRPAPYVITRINAIDQYVNGDGGSVMVTEGGAGFTFVKLRFKTKRSHGFNFILEIFGK